MNEIHLHCYCGHCKSNFVHIATEDQTLVPCYFCKREFNFFSTIKIAAKLKKELKRLKKSFPLQAFFTRLEFEQDYLNLTKDAKTDTGDIVKSVFTTKVLPHEIIQLRLDLTGFIFGLKDDKARLLLYDKSLNPRHYSLALRYNFICSFDEAVNFPADYFTLDLKEFELLEFSYFSSLALAYNHFYMKYSMKHSFYFFPDL